MGWFDWLAPVAQLGADIYTTNVNAGLTKETNAQNLEIQRTEWAREDNAYQRKVADLKAAGLNPALAAGGAGASSSLSTHMVAPQYTPPDLSRALNANLVRQQTGKSAEETRLAAASTENALAVTDAVKAEARARSQKAAFDQNYWKGLFNGNEVNLSLTGESVGQAELRARIAESSAKESEAAIQSTEAEAAKVRLESLEWALELAKKYGNIQAVMGIVNGVVGAASQGIGSAVGVGKYVNAYNAAVGRNP